MLRPLVTALIFLMAAPRATADEPFILREQPPAYPGGTEQLYADLARQTAWGLMRRAEQKVRQGRREALPEGVVPSMGMMEVDAVTLRKELGGWLLPAEPPCGRVVLALTVSERGRAADVRVLRTPDARLGEAACAAARRLQAWMPGYRLTVEGWRAAPFPYTVALRPERVQEALEGLLQERAAQEKRRKKSEQDGTATTK